MEFKNELKFYKKNKYSNDLIFSGASRNASLEFLGDIKELLERL